MTTTSTTELRTAVCDERAGIRMRILQRMFSLWFDGLVYNQIWEDPRIDLEALQVNSESRMLTIASGGCNLLNYLVADPAKITAVDLNPYHIYLTRLKIEAMRCLPGYEAFYDFFVRPQHKENVRNYFRYVSPGLDSATRAYWEKKNRLAMLVSRRKIDYFGANLYDHGRSGLFIRFLHWLCRLNYCEPSALLNCKNQEEQIEFFEDYLEPVFRSWIVRILSRLPLTVYSLGIPPQQLERLKADCFGSIVEVYRRRLRRLACNFPVSDNYFAWQAFARCYRFNDQECLPDYLKRTNYELIKSRLNRIETQVGLIQEVLRAAPKGAYDRFVFLDAQDWMTKPALQNLWFEVLRVSPSGGRMIFRSAGSASILESDLPADLHRQLVYEHSRSKELYERDRSAVYGGFHLYRCAA